MAGSMKLELPASAILSVHHNVSTALQICDYASSERSLKVLGQGGDSPQNRCGMQGRGGWPCSVAPLKAGLSWICQVSEAAVSQNFTQAISVATAEHSVQLQDTHQIQTV